MILLQIATICVVLPTNTANVDASNKREISKGHITFRILNNQAVSSEINKNKPAKPINAISDMQPEPELAIDTSQLNNIKFNKSNKINHTKYVYWKTIKAKITAYSPDALSCGTFANGKTSIGKNAWKRTGVAADPSAVPYGTMVSIPGVGLRTVDDTGSGMRKSWKRKGIYHFDLRMTYPYECRKWGIKWLKVDLYRPAR